MTTKRNKYSFSEAGIDAMYNDCVDLVFSALESQGDGSPIRDVNINISIADKEITIPLCANAFEKLFDYIREAESEDQL